MDLRLSIPHLISVILKEAFMISRLRRDAYYRIGKSTMGCVLGFVMLSLMCPTSADAKNKVRIEYGEATTPELMEIKSIVARERFLETIVEGFDQVLNLPPTITFTLATAQCDELNYFYISDTKTITICYEMMVYIAKIGVKWQTEGRNPILIQQAIRGAVQFLVLHELGHAFIDIHRISVTGRKEDVADQYAAIWILEAQKHHPELKYKPEMLDGLLFGAIFLFAELAEGELSEEAYRNEHGMSKQRYYNLKCWAYGSDSIRYYRFKQDLQDRAPRCKDEYEEALDSFKKLFSVNRP
jgi:hypothetical protein